MRSRSGKRRLVLAAVLAGTLATQAPSQGSGLPQAEARSVEQGRTARAEPASSVPPPRRETGEKAGLAFREVAAEWGIDFVHENAASGEKYMVEMTNAGVVAFDYDGDGDPDLLFVDGGPLPGYEGEPPRSRLYRNDSRGAGEPPRFVDVTEGSGLAVEGYGMGATAGDVDGDGDLDLYVTAFGPDQLFRNEGDGTFTDATAEAGLAAAREPAWSASAAFGDAEGDGDLDLYVTRYVDFSLDHHVFCGDRDAGRRSYCTPEVYSGLPDLYFRNDGSGRFTEATAAAGLVPAAGPGAGLGVVWADLDGDGASDLYVANDLDPNHLFAGRGDGTFEDVSLLSGTAFSDRGVPEAGMGVDAGDADGDGDLDLVVTHFELETNAFYRNEGQRLFTDARYPAGIAEPSLLRLGFGVAFADLDSDADLDLAVANGHVLDDAESFNPASRTEQPNQLFANVGGGRFREVTGAGLDVVRVSRGLAPADLDGDGDLDLVIANVAAAPELYQNRSERREGYLAVDLGETGLGGVGARVEATTETDGAPPRQVRQLREVRTATSFLSQAPLTVTFGLGGAETVEQLSVRWPDGTRQAFADLPAGRRLRVAPLRP